MNLFSDYIVTKYHAENANQKMADIYRIRRAENENTSAV